MPFLLEDEPANCLMIALLAAPSSLADRYMGTVRDSAGVRGVAFHTPIKFLLSRMDREAAQALAAHAYPFIPDLDEMLGPQPEADAFATEWSNLSGHLPRSGRSERIYMLDAVQAVPEMPGAMRPVREGDRAIVLPWIEAMGAEIGETMTREDVEGVFERNVCDGTLFLWEDGGPVSMTGARGSTPNSRRISLVYTPPELRGRGYASALVAAVSRRVLDSGVRWCVLYTDLANPTSNHIYQEIGYRPVCDAQEYVLRPHSV
jgi:predicted GNAT family acetyltransferase